MIEYRAFRNTDPPALCEIWRHQAPPRAYYQQLTPAVLENVVLSAPLFDRHGLVVADEDGKPVGFAHAGFARNQDGSGQDKSIGATSMLMVSVSDSRRQAVWRALLERSEQYLVDRGARELHAGGSLDLAPFYLGLHDGAAAPGVLASDRDMLDSFTEAGYVETGRTSVLQRSLTSFRPIVDRQQMRLKRSMRLECRPDPPVANWWEACTVGLTNRFAFTATRCEDDTTIATAVFWDMEPLASSWGIHARGLTQLQMEITEDREAVAIFLIGNALRQMAAEGITLVKAHVNVGHAPLQPVFSRLGFEEVEQTIELVRSAKE
ncbi:MAG: N-acetyltransferase family protein [Planctomycetota bacterium]